MPEWPEDEFAMKQLSWVNLALKRNAEASSRIRFAMIKDFSSSSPVKSKSALV